jgi:hypothetical protein
MIEKEEKIEERVVLKRVPPGDRWKLSDGDKQFSNLTSALDYVFALTGQTDFSIYARKGIVCVKSVIEVEKPIEKYSLYGED